MLCNDPTITYLKGIGYNVVRLPKEGISPLQIITKKGKVFENLGDIATALTGAVKPEIKTGIAMASISKARTNHLSTGIGITILGDIINAMHGEKIGINGLYSQARTMVFEFQDVIEDSVDEVALDQYLNGSDINPLSKHIAALLESDDVYIITAVIKSKAINVEAVSKNDEIFAIDLPLVQKIVGGNLNVETSGEKNSKITYHGSVPLVFGFKAVRLTYEDGKYMAFEGVEAGGGAMGIERQAFPLNRLLSTDSPFINLTSTESEDNDNRFDPSQLDKSIIAIPLLKEMQKDPAKTYNVIIDLNLSYEGGRSPAREKVKKLFKEVTGVALNIEKSRLSHQYLFAAITGYNVRRIIEMDNQKAPAIYKIWIDFEVSAFISKSVSTVKADAAHSSFSAMGEDITWAVIDSGIDFNHTHFFTQDFKNKHSSDEYHCDFVGNNTQFDDDFGHGTHVAGILAGGWNKLDNKPNAIIKSRNQQGNTFYEKIPMEKISGMAPKCKLVSIKVLDKNGRGLASSLIAAIEHIQEINGYGRDIKIHGINLSLGYSFEPEWFACGQSPLCVEVNRLVKSGVVVVAAAGNTGYGRSVTAFNGTVGTGLPFSINDPGNAELAITVGSTHRDMPFTYGVSYFSSKGPTGDGRLKPDLLAPGEKIISCAANSKKDPEILVALGETSEDFYIEDTGTSMAAPHVSGVIAAFLSIRREFIGRPEAVKEIFMNTATDLKRDHNFQGKGVIDLMRAIQSV